MDSLELSMKAFASFMWGLPLILLLVGGGFFFTLHSKLRHFLYLGHAVALLSGKYSSDQTESKGEISHFHALSTALAGTMGLGNITGVAVALTVGGPGAIFWMWVTAIVGISTKFYTASLAIMFRGYDDAGNLQGGPMYVIREGLGKKWMPLAWLFCVAGMMGTLPVFQVNQLVQVMRDTLAIPNGLATVQSHFLFDFLAGGLLALVVLSVAVGKIERVSGVAARLVPLIMISYLVVTGFILISNASEIPFTLWFIVTDAFSGEAVSGGVIGTVILIGVQRGAFSNEAGIGTESLAHGAAKTNEPAREGLVAMLGPIADTLIVCTCTALTLLLTGVWDSGAVGVTMAAIAYERILPGYGGYLLSLMVLVLSLTTVMTYWYYGSKCMGFLFGAKSEKFYMIFYISLILIGALVSLDVVINLLDGSYAMMAIPTMISTLLLADKVKESAKRYFTKLDSNML